MLLADIKWVDPTALNPIAMIDHPNSDHGTVLIIRHRYNTYDIYDYPSRVKAVAGLVRELSHEAHSGQRAWKNLNELEAQCVLYEIFK